MAAYVPLATAELDEISSLTDFGDETNSTQARLVQDDRWLRSNVLALLNRSQFRPLGLSPSSIAPETTN